MRRMTFCSWAVMALFAVGLVNAEDSKKKDDKDKHHDKATITKVDSKKNMLTVTMKNEDGKEVEKTFPLQDGAEYLDDQGKAAKLDAFQPGDHVRITEQDGQITELKKCLEHSHATITKVDAKKGAVAVTMKDQDGQDVDKTFQIAKGAEYFDSHGKAATLDAFQPEDHVRITEKDGQITELKKCKVQAAATITNVDAEKGTITVTMTDEDGKKTEKVFDLIEDVEYVDSTGEFATIDIFRSGDDVLIIESEGQLTELKQAKGKLTSKAPTVRATGQSKSAAIPECLEKLKLSSQQQDQIKEIIQNYDQSLGKVWNQFGQRYMQAIAMETSLLAAIEDNLTEDQRQQVRDQRHKTAQYEQAMAATNTKPNQAKATKHEETTKPANAAEEGLDAISVSLTDEQEAAADKVQEKYRAQLRSLNRDIQGLHIRLVSLEADKLVEIEKVLTKEQLKQLRMSRQTAPAAPKVAAGKTEPTKTK